MRSVSPNIEGAEEFVIAEDQLEYMPVVACLVQFGNDPITRVIRYTLTPEERKQIAEGEDLYFGTFAQHMLNPHWLKVGFP